MKRIYTWPSVGHCNARLVDAVHVAEIKQDNSSLYGRKDV